MTPGLPSGRPPVECGCRHDGKENNHKDKFVYLFLQEHPAISFQLDKIFAGLDELSWTRYLKF